MRQPIVIVLASLLGAATLVWAQTRIDVHPGKVRVMSTASDALCVGASTGASPTCTGGIQGGAATVGGLLTVNGFGTHPFSTGGTGGNIINVRNTTAGTGNYSQVQLGNDTGTVAALRAHSTTYTTSNHDVADGAVLISVTAGGLSVAATHGSGDVRFYAGGSAQRWGINDAGDWTFGASSHIADSSGTPSLGVGWPGGTTIAGTDYAFVIALPNGGDDGGAITFGHTFSTAPICVVQPGSLSGVVSRTSSLSTSSISFSPVGANWGNFDILYVLCRGY